MTVECPTCGKKIKRTVGWFKKNNQTCPHGCGTTFKTEDFRRGIKDAEDQLAKFKRDLGNIKF